MGVQMDLGLELVFSVGLLVEGMIRICMAIGMGYFGDGGWTGLENQFPPVVLLLGAIAEILFALTGIVHSLSALLHNHFSEMGTKLAIGIMIAFGWFTIFIWVVAANGYDAHHDNIQVEGYTPNQVDSLSTLAIIAGFCYCGSLQGGQVLFTNNVLAHITGEYEDRHTAASLTPRFAYYTVLYLTASVTQLAFGAYLDDHPTEQNVMFPPYVVVWRGITLAVGIFATWVALFGLLRIPLGPIGGAKPFSFMMFLSWILHLSLSIITQVSTIAPPTGATFAAAPLTLLTGALHFMPAYLDAMRAHALAKEA